MFPCDPCRVLDVEVCLPWISPDRDVFVEEFVECARYCFDALGYEWIGISRPTLWENRAFECLDDPMRS